MDFKASARRWFQRVLFLAALAGALVSLTLCRTPQAPQPVPAPPPIPSRAPGPLPAPAPSSTPSPIQTGCQAASFDPAARANAASQRTLAWSPFGRAELGWETYAPLIAREIGTACAPESSGFAQALAQWQGRQGFPASGRIDPAAFDRMKGIWQTKRAFVRLGAKRICPPAANEASLSAATTAEGYSGKAVLLRPGALAAYRRMAAAARAESAAIRADPRNLTIFSAYRSPDYDAARCARDQNCNGITRATCSPHRTGLAMDLYVGQSPGYGPDSSADPNRLAQSKSATYRWLVANGERFGFVNYPFEPWHWEWTGEQP